MDVGTGTIPLIEGGIPNKFNRPLCANTRDSEIRSLSDVWESGGAVGGRREM